MKTVNRPVRYDAQGQIIYDARGQRLLDVRGWGWMQYLPGPPAPEARQDEFALWVVDLINNAKEAP